MKDLANFEYKPYIRHSINNDFQLQLDKRIVSGIKKHKKKLFED